MKFTDLQTKTIYAVRNSLAGRAAIVLDAETMYRDTHDRYVSKKHQLTRSTSRKFESPRYDNWTNGVVTLSSDAQTLRKIIKHPRYDEFVATITNGEFFDRASMIERFFGNVPVSLTMYNPRDFEGEYAEVEAARDEAYAQREAEREAARRAQKAAHEHLKDIQSQFKKLVPDAFPLSDRGIGVIEMRLSDLEALIALAQPATATA